MATVTRDTEWRCRRLPDRLSPMEISRRWENPMVMRSIVIATSTMANPAKRLFPNSAWRMVYRTSQPRSPPLPRTAAITTIDSVARIVWLMPSMTVGMATGSRTSHRSCLRVAPDMMADSTTSSGTRLSPNITVRAIGGMAKVADAIRPTVGPNPKSTRQGTK